MKKYLTFLIFFSVLCTSYLYSIEINGYLEEIEDKTVLRVKGTFQERGYAQGYLLADNMLELMTGYMLPVIYNNNSYLYNQARAFFVANFEIEPQYETESQAIIEGVIDKGVSTYLPVLGRDLDYIDVLMNCSIVDLIATLAGACSSISSWGSSTADIPDISGEQILTRHLDWSSNNALRRNHLITVHFPSEEGLQNWINIGIAGFISALSAINEHGVGIFYNVGSNHSYILGDGFQPILFSLRTAIESADFNDDGVNNYLDIQDALENCNFISGSIIHTASILDDNIFPVVFEVNNINGLAVRTAEDNDLNPAVPDDHLAATNHFRTLYSPSYCYRYQNIADSLQVNPLMTPERSWTMLSGTAGVITNIQAMQYIPVLRELKWATTVEAANQAHSQLPTLFDIDYLLSYDDSVAIDGQQTINPLPTILIQNYPNPFNPRTIISFHLPYPTEVELLFYNLQGRLILRENQGLLSAGNHIYEWDTSSSGELSSGFYFLQLSSGNDLHYHKMLLLK